MNYYENKEKVGKYINFTPSDDGAMLVDMLVGTLPAGATILELGIGPGKDFDRLSQHFTVTGSDSSHEFLRLFREQHEHADVLYLDAITLEIERTFDCIFSNKVLIHLPQHDLSKSLTRQNEVLNSHGLVLHSFWYGSGEAEFNGLKFFYYNEQEIETLMSEYFDILDIGRHAKMAADDSVYVLARKKI